MLKRLHLRNFTVFEDADFEFGSGLNVIVGANGTGKSHVLKAGYTMELAYSSVPLIAEESPNKRLALPFGVVSLLSSIFQSDTQSELVRYIKEPYTVSGIRAQVQVWFNQSSESLGFTIDSGGANSISIINTPTIVEPTEKPVFIPTKEVLTMGWLLPLYDLRSLPIDQTYPNLLRQLALPALRIPTTQTIGSLHQLQQIIDGKVEEEGGRYYLTTLNRPRMEMNLVAEGVRKFATLYKLLANGTLTPETTLFWDEPEANLNPALLREMAVVLTELAKAGFQIILTTHSLFLLKELHILARQEHNPVRYFGLSAEPGGATTVATADNLELLPDIVALDAELDQSDRFQRVLDQEDADGN